MFVLYPEGLILCRQLYRWRNVGRKLLKNLAKRYIANPNFLVKDSQQLWRSSIFTKFRSGVISLATVQIKSQIFRAIKTWTTWTPDFCWATSPMTTKENRCKCFKRNIMTRDSRRCSSSRLCRIMVPWWHAFTASECMEFPLFNIRRIHKTDLMDCYIIWLNTRNLPLLYAFEFLCF